MRAKPLTQMGDELSFHGAVSAGAPYSKNGRKAGHPGRQLAAGAPNVSLSRKNTQAASPTPSMTNDGIPNDEGMTNSQARNVFQVHDLPRRFRHWLFGLLSSLLIPM
jgi:hypothetical protein